jgi:hypothetical protein
MKLSKTQERAVAKLTHQWQSAYDMQEGIPTLVALCRLGRAQSYTSSLGAVFSPRTGVHFRLPRLHAMRDAIEPELVISTTKDATP